MEFLSGPINTYWGLKFVTPNCMPGFTFWVGKFVITGSRHEDQRGFDLAWGEWRFVEVNFPSRPRGGAA